MHEPENVVHFKHSKYGFDGILVIDSTKLGPASGGVRILPDVNETEVRLLAKAMTRKNAFFNISAGGVLSGFLCRFNLPTLHIRERVKEEIKIKVAMLLNKSEDIAPYTLTTHMVEKKTWFCYET